MTQEEKAKAYDEAKYIMKEYLESGNAGVIAENTIKKAFPELAESEDERIKKAIIEGLREMKSSFHTISSIKIDDVITWLEKQGEQKPAKWSKEDEDYYDTIIAKLEVTQDDAALTDNQMNFLKSLKNRVQPKQDWSEEDEQMMAAIEHHLNNCGASITSILWFKSLKDRYAWKPSEEQLDVLHDAAVYVDKSMFPYPKGILMKLYKQLKKL